MRYHFVAIIALISCAPRGGQTAPAAATTNVEAGALRTRLFALADDSMMGRAPGDIGNFKASAYVAKEFERAGLVPAGEQRGWFQTVPFFRRTADPKAVLRLDDTPARLGRDYAPAPGSPRYRPIDGLTIIYAGVASDSASWISSTAAKGHVLLFSVVPPEQRTVANRRTPIGPIQNGPRFANAAAIFVAELDAVGPSAAAQYLTGNLVIDTTWRELPPVTLVTNEFAERLLGRKLEGAAPGTIGKTVHGSTQVRLFPLEFPARNVVGILRGSDPKLAAEFVSVTAHNDHVGFDHAPVDHDSLRAFDTVVRPLGADSPNRQPTTDERTRITHILDSLRAIRPARQDSIRNGADDDGTGTVALIEIARALGHGVHPRRSILFVSHTAEEFGLLGSQWYTDHPTVERDSIVGEIDMDMIGRGDARDLPGGSATYLEVIGLRRLSTEFGDVLAAANARQPLPFVFNLTFDAPGHPLQYYCRADHYSYARYGIPSVALSRGEHMDYHQVTDEAQYIDYDSMARVANFVKDAVLELATRPTRPLLDKPKGDPKAQCRQ